MTRHALALLLLPGCLSLGVSQQRDAAVQALDAATVCFVEDSSDGPAWYDPYDTCVHHDPRQAVIIANEYGWGAPLGMYAHEIGHVIEDREGRAYDDERKADEWAGCALARAGEDMRGTVRLLTERNPGPPVYESTKVRIADTSKGYNRCLDKAQH